MTIQFYIVLSKKTDITHLLEKFRAAVNIRGLSIECKSQDISLVRIDYDLSTPTFLLRL